jgi:[ribosomal protein S5]-alanine N-acetyltransferase
VRLVPAELALLDAALESDDALAEALGLEVAPGWSGEFPEALQFTRDAVAADPESVRWGTRLFVEGDTLVGWGGFKGPPTPDGEVELGYAIAPDHRRRGLATAAVSELVAEADAGGVRSVIAHTLAEHNASTRVLEKSGFEHDGDAEEDGLAVWRWRLERPRG